MCVTWLLGLKSSSDSCCVILPPEAQIRRAEQQETKLVLVSRGVPDSFAKPCKWKVELAMIVRAFKWELLTSAMD